MWCRQTSWQFTFWVTYENLKVLCSDGWKGYAQKTPYHFIHVGAMADRIPIKLINQSKKFIITVPLWYVKFMFPIINLFGNKFLLFASKVNGYFIPGLENLTKESLYNIIYFNKNIDNSKAKKELDLKIRPLRETIKDYVKWMT